MSAEAKNEYTLQLYAYSPSPLFDLVYLFRFPSFFVLKNIFSFIRRPDGSLFQAPCQHTHDTLAAMPKKGDIVTFTFESFSNRSLPVNPEISRIRADLTWREVLRHHASSTSANSQRLNGMNAKGR